MYKYIIDNSVPFFLAGKILTAPKNNVAPVPLAPRALVLCAVVLSGVVLSGVVLSRWVHTPLNAVML
jgi:hypothetical protein